MSALAEPRTSLLDEPHHDGSELGVLERPEGLGGEATVRLRVPRAAGADAVVLRYVRDGEPHAVRAELDGESEAETWWRASFPVANPATPYRWLLSGGSAGYAWVNGLGVSTHDVPDADDFVLTAGPTPPEWHLRSAVYEIFPDRFASSGLGVEPPEWAVRRVWDELPTGRGRDTQFEWFGGDLRGIEQHLDHVEELGANVLYLTPIFPAGSTHRYDSTTFEHVDPLLGGDEALASLTRAAHARGMRVLGDLTLNHIGNRHSWFESARLMGDAPERELFYFDDALPHGYEAWAGVRTLPKLAWESDELRRRMAAAARRWLDAPYSLDGWRIDVANMAGRRGETDEWREVVRTARSAAGGSLLIGEHAHDARFDLGAEGWDGTMNYAGFMRPVWAWLRGDDRPPPLDREFLGLPVGVPRLDGPAAVATMRAFRAGVPWESTLHSWALLDSHDVARFRTVTGSPALQEVGIGLQATTPGVPMVFAGDELGLEGSWGEDARRTMPWDRPETWDTELLATYRRLLALRRSSDALARGGIRYAHVGADAIAYLRETREERLLCLAARDDAHVVRLPLDALGCSGLEPVYGDDATIAAGHAVLPAGGPAFHVWRLV